MQADRRDTFGIGVAAGLLSAFIGYLLLGLLWGVAQGESIGYFHREVFLGQPPLQGPHPERVHPRHRAGLPPGLPPEVGSVRQRHPVRDDCPGHGHRLAPNGGSLNDPFDSRPQRLYILTGEPSGEAHAARVVERIRDQWPEVEIRGMGGDAMEAQGVDLLEHVSNTAIMGFAEVVAKLGFIRTLMARVKADILAFRPDRILIVDYPGFNLRMARWAREQGFPVDMYIGPQVWAWKRRRVHAMARDLDRLSVILPFEKAAYAGVDLDVEFVGHPLLGCATPRRWTSPPPALGAKRATSLWTVRCSPSFRAPGPKKSGGCSRSSKAARSLPDHMPVVAGAPGRAQADYETDLPVLFGDTPICTAMPPPG